MFLIVLNHYPWVEQDEYLPRLLNAILRSWGGRWRLSLFYDQRMVPVSGGSFGEEIVQTRMGS